MHWKNDDIGLMLMITQMKLSNKLLSLFFQDKNWFLNVVVQILILQTG